MLHDSYDFRFTVRLTSAQYLELCDYADKFGISVGHLVRNIIDSYLKNEDK